MNSKIMQRWMEMVQFRITEGSDYGWQCFGYNAYTLSSWDGDQAGTSFNITFDTKDQTVFMIEAHDFSNDRAYRWISPAHQSQFTQEVSNRSITDEAWEDVRYVDLEVVDDWFEKATAIFNGESYDERVQVPIDFSDEELLRYMKAAHEKDMTFNQFVEEALRYAIDEYHRDPEGMKQRAQEFKRGE